MMILQDNERKKTGMYSNILMVLTSVHHLYGSIVYETPWRAHVLFLSIPVIVITLFLNRYLQTAGKASKKVLLLAYWLIILLASVILIGLFEGLYNHVLKNVLFFSSVPVSWLHNIFPPGVYEMPNNVFFEVTGVMQGIIAIPLIIHFIKFTGYLLKTKVSIL